MAGEMPALNKKNGEIVLEVQPKAGGVE